MVYENTTLGFRLAIFTKDIKPSSIVHPHSQMIETHGDKVGFHINRNGDRWLLQHRIVAVVNQLPKLFQFKKDRPYDLHTPSMRLATVTSRREVR